MVPSHSSAFEPGNGGLSVGGMSMLYSPRASDAISDARQLHLMLKETERGYDFSFFGHVSCVCVSASIGHSNSDGGLVCHCWCPSKSQLSESRALIWFVSGSVSPKHMIDVCSSSSSVGLFATDGSPVNICGVFHF